MTARTLVVIPTYNEAANIALLLDRLFVASDVDVVIVDDGSPDGTARVARATGSRLGRAVDVIERAAKSGYGSACRAGFALGLDRGYAVIMQMDADLSHQPEDVPRLLAELGNGADVVIGSRYVPGGTIPGWSRARKLLSRAGNGYARLCLGLRISDATAGFRAYRAPVLAGMDLTATRTDGYGFQIEMADRVRRSGAHVVEVPIEFADRSAGRSKMSNRIVVEALWMVTRLGVRRAARRVRVRHR
jgi:glycosyltransferase involved in cell wall biosynthesis